MANDLAPNQDCRITDIALLVAGFYFYTCIYQSSQFWAFLAFVAVNGLFFLKNIHQSYSKQEHLGCADEMPSKTKDCSSSDLDQVFSRNFYNRSTKYLEGECATKIALPPTEHDDDCSVYEEGFIALRFAVCAESNGTDKNDKGAEQQAGENRGNETSNNGGVNLTQCVQNMNIGGASGGDRDEGDGSGDDKGQKENRTCGSNMVKKKRRKKKKTRKKKEESLDANVACNPTSGEPNVNQGSNHVSVDEHGQSPCAIDRSKESLDKSRNDPVSSDVNAVDVLSKTIEKYSSSNQESGITFPYFNKDELGLCDGFYGQGKEYTVLDPVGRGSFGTCVLITDLSLIKNFVRKEVETSDVREAKFMLHLDRHPNVVTLLGADYRDGKLHLFMNYADGGSLKKYMSEIGFSKVPLNQKLKFAHEIISGLLWLKKKYVLHRDLKTDNVLVFCGKTVRVKVADFGHSVILNSDCLSLKDGFSVFHYWTSPEILRGDAYSFRADLWSALCILYHLETGKPPWQECKRVFQLIYKVGNCRELPVLDDVSVRTKHIYVKGFCLQECRPDAEVFLHLIGMAIVHQQLLAMTSMG